MRIMKFICLFCISALVWGQGLFETAQRSSSLAYDLNGGVRSGIRVDHDKDSLYSKELYARSDLRLRINAGTRAYALTEISFEYGYAALGDINTISLREAYIDIQGGPLHLRAGKQIETWGRTDAFSSVDQLTPQDLRRILPDADDMRLGNFMLNTHLQLGAPIRLQGIWLPYYRANEIPVSIFSLPEGVEYQGLRPPPLSFSHSGGGLRVDLYTMDYDAAFSYLNSYALQPGFAGKLTMPPESAPLFLVYQQPWRQKLFAFDAAFNVAAWSFRFESSLMRPDSAGEALYIPESEVQWTLGVDRSFSSLSILAEYNGKYIPDHRDMEEAADPLEAMDYKLKFYNRLLARQSKMTQHQLFVRIALTLFHDRLGIELPFMYYFTTKEYALSPQIRLELANAMNLYLGAGFYAGDDDTLFDLMGYLYNGYFAELKLIF